MTTINPRPHDFVWAHKKDANLKEPIPVLKEKGWQYADVPTASNFNWLFNELSKWNNYLEGRINSIADDHAIIHQDLNRQTRELRRDLKLTITMLQALLTKMLSHHPDSNFILPKLPDIKE